MNIKDPEVRLLALELAKRRHTSMTDAVRQALEEALEKERVRRVDIVERLEQMAERWRAEGGTVVSDDELYDEWGLPR
jgi:antitoxin VapB